jgi:hypothetical protein
MTYEYQLERLITAVQDAGNAIERMADASAETAKEVKAMRLMIKKDIEAQSASPFDTNIPGINDEAKPSDF